METNSSSPSGSPAFPLWTWELVIYSLLTILGISGNTVVCFVILKGGALVRKNPFNTLLLGLAITDLILSVILIPNYILTTSAFTHPSGEQGDLFCKLVTGNFFPFFMAHVSVYILVGISLERLRAIQNPFLVRYQSRRRPIVVILLSYFCAMLVQSPTLYGVRYSKSHATYGNACTVHWSPEWVGILLYGTVFTIQLIVPFFTFIYVFMKTRKRFKDLEGCMKNQGGRAQFEQQRASLEKRKRTVRIVTLLVLVFFLSWTPNNIAYFLYQAFQFSWIQWNGVALQITILLGMCSVWINPFLYAFQSTEFRRHCRRAFSSDRWGIYYERIYGTLDGSSSDMPVIIRSV